MKKLDHLRNHLLASVPSLKHGPERLLTFIQDGSVQFQRGASLSHEYQVDAQIVITDFSGELDTLMIPLLQWLAHYQPDLDPAEAVRFEAEILSHHAWDIALTVRLTERVVALVDCEAGQIRSEHRMPEFPLEICGTTDWQLYLRAPGEEEWTATSSWSDTNG